MSRTLTARQAEELHKSIIAYLSANNLPDSATALRTELSLGEDVYDPATAKKYETLLEKKWTSVVRLQKKIMDLEGQVETLRTELDSATPTSLSNRKQDPASWLPSGPPRHVLQSHRTPINCVAFHPIFSSIASGDEDATIKIWDWEFGELERTVKGHTKAVLDLDYGGPKGHTLLASCSSDLTIKLWDPSDEYKNIRTLPGHDHSVSAVRFIPSGAPGAPMSGNLLASASRDVTVRIWDVTTGYCVKTIRGHADWIRDVCPSLDGRYLLSTGNDRTLRLWDISISTPETKLVMVGHEHFVECCTFAPPAAYQYLAPLAGLKKPPPANSAAEFMASGARDKTIRLWDARGTCIKTLIGHDNWVRSLVFHPSGKFLLSVADDKTLRCWDLSQEGKCVKVLEGAHEHFITSMRWAPPIVKDKGGDGDQNGDSIGTPKKAAAMSQDVQIRCVIATGSVDMALRIFAR
ncbi:Fc.00g093430.m01.CDS01 [Cosmosporella sp. VM-42]